MDPDAVEALAGLCRRAVAPELAVLERRLEALERSPAMAFTQAEAIAQRQRVVARMREAGLSVERISQSLGVPRTTALRDLDAVGIRVPDRVLGVDGRSHPATHAWGRRNGNGTGGGGGERPRTP